MRELWIIETKFESDPDTDYYWRPQLDLVYETGQTNAEIGVKQVMKSNPGLMARAVKYIPDDRRN